MDDEKTALVLGGGGATGVAWEIGVLHGLAEAGVDLSTATTLIGTSAGAVVASRLATGTSCADAYAGELAPAAGSPKPVSPLRLVRLAAALARPGSADRRQARIGRLALRATPVLPHDERLAMIRSLIGDVDWPERDVRITAVEAETGAFTVFDRQGPVDLLHAVAASCAVPLTWPPVAIDGRHYIDGGMRSPTNADLAAGADAVIVLAPLPGSGSGPTAIATQLAATGAARTTIVRPDDGARAAMGRNPLDVTRRGAAAEAGRRQAAAVIDAVRQVWAPATDGADGTATAPG